MTLPNVLDKFDALLPPRPAYWDPICNKVVWSNKQSALASNRIQFNHKHARHWIAFDIDDSQAALAWEDCGLAPTLIIQNLVGRRGHAHLLYLLERPVIVAEGKEGASAVRYYAAVRRGLTAALKADRGYANFLCKNPINALAHGFRVTSVRSRPYTLGELARYVDTGLPVGHLREDEGRNCFTFSRVSKWAYRNCFRYTDQKVFLQAVLAQCQRLQETFFEPLPDREVVGIAKSIVPFCWTRFTAPPSSDVGVLRLDPSLCLSARQSMGASYVNRSRTEATREKIGMAVHRLGERATQKEVSELCDLSLSTVKRHWHSSPVVDITKSDWR